MKKMNRESLVILPLAMMASAVWAQQPVKVTHLSVPVMEQVSITVPGSGYTPMDLSSTGNNNVYNQVQQQMMQANFTSPVLDDYKYLKLPPIEVLFEYARANPMTEYHNLRRKEASHDLKSIKKQWLRFLNVNASYRYGYLGASTGVENQFDPTLPLVYSYYNQRQSWWSVGASFVLPLDEIFDRGNRTRKIKTIMEQSQYEAETWYNEHKLKIIESYTNAGMYLNLIRIKSEAASLAQQQFAMSQADFINGRIGVTELSYAKGIQNTSTTEYEQTRANLYQAILRLEALSNYKILNK